MQIVPYVGQSKKTGKEFHCFKLSLGDWETLIFPQTQFEYKYLAELIGSGIKS